MVAIRELLDYSIFRFLVGAIAVIGSTLGTQLGIAWIGSLIGLHAADPAWWGCLEFSASAVAAFFCYRFYVRRIERRNPNELSLDAALREGSLGLVLGACLFLATLAVLAGLGLVEISISEKPAATALTLGIVLQAGVAEELLFRGLVLRLAERSFGTWPALVISALLFGGAHLFNPGAGVASFVSIATEAAVLQGAAYLYTRRLWLPIGLHFSWGLVESFVFGVADSGNQYPGLLQTKVHGPALLSGGAFGVETSIVAMGLAVVAAIFLLVMASRRGNIVPAHWGADSSSERSRATS